MTEIHKHQHVTYSVRQQTFSAIVRRVHRDGTATIEARHLLDETGEPRGSYLGFRYRMEARDLMPASEHQS